MMNLFDVLARIRENKERWEKQAEASPNISILCIGIADEWKKLEKEIEDSIEEDSSMMWEQHLKSSALTPARSEESQGKAENPIKE